MGHARVLKDGSYIKPAHAKIGYATMLYARAVIAEGAAFKLAQAATIATRYSVVREQGFGWEGEPSAAGKVQIPIMSYRQQNFRLLTVISRAYAILFTARKLRAAVADLKSGLDKGDFSLLGYYHVLFAGLKAWNTQVACEGAEDARKCCGGHGYLLTSGMPSIVAEATAPATFEGENYVMYLQVGRSLLKWLRQTRAGKPSSKEMSSLREAFDRFGPFPERHRCTAVAEDFLTASVQREIFQRRAIQLIHNADYLEDSERQTGSPSTAFNSLMMEIIAAARAYIELLVLEEFISRVAEIASQDTAIYAALSRLRSLFALTTIVHPQSYDAISFTSDGYLSSLQMHEIKTCVGQLLDELLPDAICLTDAWDFSDASLCSAIGCYDGNVYERLMSWTRQLPMNQKADDLDNVSRVAWEKHTRPALNTSLRSRL
jgi:acyl-CoA oxidase